MIEQILLFSLGFLVSSLLGLLLLPALWNRAVRISRRQLEMQLPLSMTEIVAERDQLRAEFAVEARRIEQKAEHLVVLRTQDQEQLTHQATALAALETRARHLDAEIAAAGQELEQTRSRLAETAAELGATHQAHWDALGQISERDRRLAAEAERFSSLHETAEERRATLASLETRIAGLEIQLEDARKTEASLRLDLADRESARQRAEDESQFNRIETTSALHKRDQALKDLEASQARIAELEEQHRAERRAKAHAENERVAAEHALDVARIDETSLRAAHERRLEVLRVQEGQLAQQLEDLRAQNAALQGALEAARRINSVAPPGAPDPAIVDENNQLRLAITEVAAEVSRLISALEAEAPPLHDDSRRIDDRLRALQESEARRTVAAG